MLGWLRPWLLVTPAYRRRGGRLRGQYDVICFVCRPFDPDEGTAWAHKCKSRNAVARAVRKHRHCGLERGAHVQD